MIYVYDMGKDASCEGMLQLDIILNNIFEHKKTCNDNLCGMLRHFESTLLEHFIALKFSTNWDYKIKDIRFLSIPQPYEKPQKVCTLIKNLNDQCFFLSSVKIDFSYNEKIIQVKIKENISSENLLHEFSLCKDLIDDIINETSEHNNKNKNKPSDHSKDSLSEFKRIK